ncbi:DivIVA domain-containing protein, partial [Frankia sp. AgKG'84/4]|nr:DivIVA domain-containing protein [Frankia sp. AgKG'84/4]
MGEHDHGTDPGSAADRPAFDEVAHGYDPRQVDDYLASLWRYASQVTSRAAAAESALKHERERNGARAGDGQSAAHAGARIGQMLAIAEQQAEEIVEGARRIAESALEEVIEDAGANHPIVREARGQAEKLLLDAVEESQRLALRRHQELAEDLARSSASLDTLRHQQGEIIGAVLRLRGILGSDELDRAVTELARAGAEPRPDDPADETGAGAARGARRPASAR